MTSFPVCKVMSRIIDHSSVDRAFWRSIAIVADEKNEAAHDNVGSRCKIVGTC